MGINKEVSIDKERLTYMSNKAFDDAVKQRSKETRDNYFERRNAAILEGGVITHYTIKERGDWIDYWKELPDRVHAIKFKNGRCWDEVNGFRNYVDRAIAQTKLDSWAPSPTSKNPLWVKGPLSKLTVEKEDSDLEKKFKYNESKNITEFKNYVINTYRGHYIGRENIQSLDLIFATERGEGFCIGNILKLAARYGKKGGKNRADLLKILHYALLTMYLLDKETQ
jgi:hypothetical protein